MGEPIMTVQMGSNVLDPDSGALKEWLSLLNRIYNEDASHMSFEEMNSTSTDWLKIFLNGDVAMLPNGEWTVGNAKQELANNAELAGKCDMGVTYMPQPDGVQEPVTIGGHNTFIFISSQSKKFENAFEFIRFLTGAEGAKLLAEGGMLSSYTDDTIEQEYRELSGLDNTDAFFNTEIRYEMPPTGNGAEADAIWREEKELCLIGEKSVDEAIASFDQRRTPLLSQE
jgi:multiple sugar transport system substrate-binding protein